MIVLSRLQAQEELLQVLTPVPASSLVMKWAVQHGFLM